MYLVLWTLILLHGGKMKKTEVVKLYKLHHKRLSNILGLKGWHIKVHYDKGKDQDGDEVTEMSLDNFNPDYNEVDLTIYYTVIDTESAFARVLLHEYLHIVISPAMRHVPADKIADEEKVVSHLTNVLASHILNVKAKT